MLGETTENVRDTVGDAGVATTTATSHREVIRLICSGMLKFAVVFRQTYCLSAREPTMVPNTIDDPNPAMKSRPISPLSYP